jgi:hypothetical protein
LIVESSGPLVTVVVPPVALLPLVVIMLPVEVVVRSVALLPLAAVVPRRRALCRHQLIVESSGLLIAVVVSYSSLLIVALVSSASTGRQRHR